MKSLRQYITEQLSTLISQRMNITVQRLAYLRFAMEDNKNDEGLKEMYDTLYNLVFAKDGHVRSNQELLDYIKKTMEDNLGNIPGLPNNDAIENIDKKIVALDELDPNKLQHYMKEVEKEISDSKSKASKEDSKTSFDKDISDKELMEKISELVDTEGLSNILGLESDRKMSKDDKTKLKQKEDPIGSEDPSEEDELKKEDSKDSESKDNKSEDSESEMSEEEAQKKMDGFLKNGTFESLVTEAEQLSEKDRQKNIEQTLIGIKSLANTSDGKQKEKYEKHYQFLKNCTYDENGKFRSIEDAQKYCLDNQKKELGGTFQMIKLAGTLSMTGNEEARQELKEADLDAWSQAEKDFNNDIKKGSSEEESKEEVVKDKDGSEIHARQKKSGEGNTYVRIKDGKEIGYATKDEFLKAKKSN